MSTLVKCVRCGLAFKPLSLTHFSENDKRSDPSYYGYFTGYDLVDPGLSCEEMRKRYRIRQRTEWDETIAVLMVETINAPGGTA